MMAARCGRCDTLGGMNGHLGWRPGLGLPRVKYGHVLGTLAAAIALHSTTSARADVNVGRMVERWRLEASSTSQSSGDPFHVMSRRSDGVMRLLVSARAEAGTTPPSPPHPDMVTIRPGLFAWSATPEDVATLVDARPDLKIS
jgi:hypothetical protein